MKYSNALQYWTNGKKGKLGLIWTHYVFHGETSGLTRGTNIRHNTVGAGKRSKGVKASDRWPFCSRQSCDDRLLEP